MPQELVDFGAYLTNLRENIDNLLGEQIKAKSEASIDTLARATLQEILIELGTAAINSLVEFDNAELQQLFFEMLSRPSHISVQKGNLIKAFDEELAGTPSDLLMVPGGHTMTQTAPFIWKYGIYKPAREGFVPNTKSLKRIVEKIKGYDAIIAERVSYWRGLGNRAPFWLIINYGTAAFGDEPRAYPQFQGTHFVEQFRMIALRVVERAKYVYVTNVAESLGAEVEEILREPKKGGRVVIARIPVGDASLSVLYSSAGNVFFQIGRRSLSFQEAKALVKRSYK